MRAEDASCLEGGEGGSGSFFFLLKVQRTAHSFSHVPALYCHCSPQGTRAGVPSQSAEAHKAVRIIFTDMAFPTLVVGTGCARAYVACDTMLCAARHWSALCCPINRLEERVSQMPLRKVAKVIHGTWVEQRVERVRQCCACCRWKLTFVAHMALPFFRLYRVGCTDQCMTPRL